MAKRRPRRASNTLLLRSAEALGRMIGTLQRQLEATQVALRTEPTRKKRKKTTRTRKRTKRTGR